MAADSGQHQKSPRRSEDTPPPDDAGPEAAQDTARKEQLDDDVDAILGDIDSVLETNAEEFVRGFVQKGGQ